MTEKWETEGLGESNFHSSREERHEMGGFRDNREQKGFFRRNPSFKIFIIDLILIVIISGVLVPYLYKREGSARLDGYELTVRAFYYDDNIMISLTVKGGKDSLSPGSYMEACFRTESSGDSVTVSDITPRKGEERILKATLKDISSAYVFCDVSMNGQNKTIKKKIK